MLGYILKRLLLAVPTLFAVLTIVFVLARVLPGDPAQTILGDQASQEALVAMRHRLGVDKPIPAQYVDFLLNALQGEWGNSLVTGNLTLHGVTKQISFPAKIQVTDDAVEIAADFFINRFDFDIKYPGKANDLIRKEVVLKVKVRATPPASRS